MAEYVEAPEEWNGDGPSIFLAGGITDCPDWQHEATIALRWNSAFAQAVILNPRRENFPMDDPSAAPEQIEWEFRHLERASVILFWFARGPSPQPIALYELGRHAALGRRIAVGVDPAYVRATDVVIQLEYARPGTPVLNTLRETCAHAIALLRDA